MVDPKPITFSVTPETVEALHPNHVAVAYDDVHQVLINGNPVQTGAFKFVVRIRTGNAGCTASVVGPRVVATAAHCANTGATSTFSIDGVTYSAKITRHPDYPGVDRDLALGVIDKDVVLTEYGSVANAVDLAKVGDALRLMGYGCTQPGGTGGNDGVLREGMATITGFSGNDIVTGKAGEGALCFGDSGGPSFLQGNGKLINIAQNSKGDIKVRSYLARWDAPTGQSFLVSFAKANSVEICGFTKECGGAAPGGKTFTADGATISISGTVKDTDLAANMDYVKRMVQWLIAHFDAKGN